MELKHYLNDIEIDEPIGFDNLKMTMKRGEYHGMSAEVSELSLEFYGAAADIVRTAYQTDLDTEVAYTVTADGEEMYHGVLDLSTYEEQRSAYCSVSCKVGEVGVKTTFNNRAETEVDLNTTKTLDGKNVAHNYSWKKLSIPQKHIRYVNQMNNKEDDLYAMSKIPHAVTWCDLNEITFSNSEVNEFGTINQDGNVFTQTEGFSEAFGVNTKCTLYAKVELRIDKLEAVGYGGTPYIDLRIVLYGGTEALCTTTEQRVIGEVGQIMSFVIPKTEYSTPNTFRITLQGYRNEDFSTFSCEFSILGGSEAELNMYDNLPNTSEPVDTLFIHEALNKITEIISENALTVKSDLYSRFDSIVNKHTATSEGTLGYGYYFGDSALKVITNGYKIRGLFSTGTQRNMPLSFKEIIESLNAIDCIGWGIVNEDSGTFVRVERWSWFYQHDTILRISNPNEIKKEIDTSLIITEMTIGYKKYSTSDDIASIDSIMSERTFTTTTKAINNATNKLCEFIADNYAIELTRRSATNKKKEEEFKYDENIFIFSLAAKINTSGIAVYSIDTDIEKADTSIERSNEIYNAKLSPARSAYNWINRLFCVVGIKPFVCTSGTINYTAKIKTKISMTDGAETTFRMTDNVNIIPEYTQILPQGGTVSNIKQNAENYTLQERYYRKYQLDSTGRVNTPIPSSDDMIIPRIFKAETLSFTYPLTIAQYKAIKANPYGLIEVDGIQGWIKEFTYSFADGEATFKLIPKAY